MNAPKQTTLAEMRPKAPEVPQHYAVSLTDSQGFELAQRAAKLLASSQLVPKEYQGNIPNCVIALNMSQRMGADPLMIMQNLVPVHGKPTWSSQFLIATVNTSGRFTSLRYEFFGEPNTDNWGCRAWAIEKATNEKLVGTDITLAIAKKEGWYGKNGSKWQSIPQQMLMYRAGAWWTRAYAPELSMGLQTSDEAADIIDLNPDGTVASVTTGSLRTRVSTHAPIERDANMLSQETPANIDTATGEMLDREQDAALRKIESVVKGTSESLISGEALVKDTPESLTKTKAQANEPPPPAEGVAAVPTFEDAIAFVESGDFDMALDIARDIACSLPEGQKKQIEVSIANAQVTAGKREERPRQRMNIE